MLSHGHSASLSMKSFQPYSMLNDQEESNNESLKVRELIKKLKKKESEMRAQRLRTLAVVKYNNELYEYSKNVSLLNTQLKASLIAERISHKLKNGGLCK